MRYRPDIDGLRAVAVIAVVLFHSGLPGIGGGFVGVDIFFVISGYLIGGQIFRDVDAGEFSFAAFYARRVRRILPALLAMILILFATGVVLLTPPELRELGKEAVATVAGASNLLFYTGGGYFGPTAEDSPLLMTWSLGIEEQFYVIFPFFALALVRQKLLSPRVVLFAFCIFSFAASVVLTNANPQAAFYLLPTRGWELALGVLLALQERRSPALPSRAEGAANAAGVAMIAAAILLYRPEYSFPGVFAALPTIGAALLIASPNGAASRFVLAHPVAQFLGKISYSWYLWHWPIFYLNRTLGEVGSAVHPVKLILLSLVLGCISWALIEQPFRRRVLPQNVVLFRYAVVSAAVIAVAFALYRSDGWPQRLTEREQRYTTEASDARDDLCLAPYGAVSAINTGTCLPPTKANASGRMILLGDSHASSLSAGVKRLAEANSLTFGQMTKTSCPPLAGYAATPEIQPGYWEKCWAFQRNALAYIARHDDIRVVALVGYWSPYMLLRSDSGNRGKATSDLHEALDQTIRGLQAMGKQVVLVQDVPSFRFDPYARVIGTSMPWRAAIRTALRGSPVDHSLAPPSEIRPDPSRNLLRELARTNSALVLVDPAAQLCNSSGCRFASNDALFYYDVQHLTPAGALAAIPAARLPTPVPQP